MAKKSKLNISSPILYIALGVLLMIFKMQTLGWAMTIAGAFFLLVGLLDLLGKRIYSAIVNFAIGAIILIIGWTILEIVLIVFGILVAARGVMDLVEIVKSKRRNALAIIVAAFTVVIGIALAFGNLIGNLIWIIGLLLVIDGVLGLLGLVDKKK